MEAYAYVAQTIEGQERKGQIWASSVDEVAIRLRHEKLYIVSITAVKKHRPKKWKHKDIIEFSYQMGLLIESGIPLRRIMELVSKRQSPRIPYQSICADVQQGKSLSQSLTNCGFPQIGIALLRAGEVAGTLGVSFQLIKSYYEKEQQHHQKIMSAISYPIFLLSLMVVFFFVAVLFILPSFKKVFITMKIELPLMTRILFSLGDLITNHSYTCVTICIVLVATMVIGYRLPTVKHRIHKRLWSQSKQWLWLSCMYYTGILRVWALLLESGISLLEALPLTEPLWQNLYGRERAQQISIALRQGQTFHTSLQDCDVGNEFIWDMVSIGEESGELVSMLSHCSHYYEAMLARYISNLERLLEPILLSVMGIGVGILVVSVMYPMFTSISAISK